MAGNDVRIPNDNGADDMASLGTPSFKKYDNPINEIDEQKVLDTLAEIAEYAGVDAK